jgi:hypothetical protein
MNRTTESGRHFKGTPIGRPGSIRGGQAEPAGNKGGGITASRPAMRPQPGVLADQAETSSDLQRRLTRSPQPFTNDGGAATMKPPAHPDYRSSGSPSELRDRPKSVGCANTSLSSEEMAAIGYDPGATKGDWSIISGHATKNNQRQAGRPGKTNQSTSAKENARMRQRPGGF